MTQPDDPGPSPSDGSRPAARSRRNFPLLFVLLGLLMIALLMMNQREQGVLTVEDVDTIDRFVDEEIVQSLTIIDGERVRGEFRSTGKNPHPESITSFELKYAGPRDSNLLTPERLQRWAEKLREINAKLTYDQSGGGAFGSLIAFLPWLLLILLFWWLMFRQMRNMGGGGVMQFGRSRARMHMKERSETTFEDVAGVEEALDEVSEIVSFLRSPQKFRRIGARIPRGVLLVGPPGCGKTLLAKAIAGEAGVPFFSVSGSDFVEMFVGVGASRVRDLFKQARESSPCIVFLDEIDAVGRRRGTGLGGGHDEREQTLNQILVEMDGFDTDQGIILLAATNRPDVLDPALLRPGRFDRQIVIHLPDVKGREKILRVHSRKVKMAPEVDLVAAARATPGFSGADLEALINEAALMAATAGRERVVLSDLEEARDKIRFGRSRKSLAMTESEKRLTAYHEAGHAIVTVLEPKADPLHKVTIIPRGMALGVTMSLPERDRYGMSRSEILARLRVCYGGRLAEELVCEDITSGAQNDIEQATELARLMVTKWGMSEKVGPISLAEGEEHLFLGREVTRTQDHSEATAQLIDSEVRGILVSAHEDARALLLAHMDALHAVAEALLRYETLDGAEVQRLVEGVALDDLRPEPAAARARPAASPARGEARSPETRKDDPLTDGGRPAEGFAY
jgi:cell division protease FtsH